MKKALSKVTIDLLALRHKKFPNSSTLIAVLGYNANAIWESVVRDLDLKNNPYTECVVLPCHPSMSHGQDPVLREAYSLILLARLV